MKTEAVVNHSPTLDRLSYPDLRARVSECVFGSARKEALKALRMATAQQWEYVREPMPQVTVTDGVGRRVAFCFTSGNELHSVHLQSNHGAQSIAGDCEMAQRLSRFASRSLGVLLERYTASCWKDLQAFAQENLIAPSSYDQQHWHRHLRTDGYESTKKAIACVELPLATVRVTQDTVDYREPLESRLHLEAQAAEIRYQQELRRQEMYQEQYYYPSAGNIFAPLLVAPSCQSQSLVVLPVPSYEGPMESFEASLKNEKLDAIARAFQVAQLEKRFSRLLDAQPATSRGVLAGAIERARGIHTANSKGI